MRTTTLEQEQNRAHIADHQAGRKAAVASQSQIAPKTISPLTKYVIDLSILLAVCALLFFFKLGAVGLIDPGDAYYTEGAREMVESGNYLLPQLNFQTFFGKPVLIFWLISAAYHVFGINEFAGRFWSAAFASISVFTAYGIGRSLSNRRTGLLSALVLASAPFSIMFARQSTIDMTFSGLLWLSLCAFVLTVALRKRAWWPVLYIALGLSVLTKGPAGLVFYGATAAAYLIMRRISWSRFLGMLSSLRLAWGIPLLLLVALPWYLMAAKATDGLWTKVFFVYENVGRFAGVTNCHHATPWFYLPVLAWGFAPWIVFLPAAIKSALGDASSARRLTMEQRDGLVMLAAWSIGVFALLSFTGTQMNYYILPIFAPMAVLIGSLFDRWMAEHKQMGFLSRWLTLPTYALTILGPVFAFAAAAGITLLARSRVFPEDIVTMGLLGCFIFGAGWIATYGFLKERAIQGALINMLVSCTLAAGLMAPLAFDSVYRYMQQDLRDVTVAMKGHEGVLAMYKCFYPSVMYYMNSSVHCIFHASMLYEDPNLNYPLYLISRDEDFAELDQRLPGRFQVLEHNGHWELLLAQHINVINQPTLATTYARCLNNIMYDSKDWGPLGVPYFAGAPPAKSSFKRWM